jgi:hypothetical protein
MRGDPRRSVGTLLVFLLAWGGGGCSDRSAEEDEVMASAEKERPEMTDAAVESPLDPVVTPSDTLEEPAAQKASGADGGEAPAVRATTAAAETEPHKEVLAPSGRFLAELRRTPGSRDELIPLAPMGIPRRPSLLDGAEVENLREDPEIASVRRGRRDVERLTDFELADASDSDEALAKRILELIHADDYAAMHAIRVDRKEFDTLFWPEFPQSRPFTNMKSGDAWMFHEANCRDGVNEALSEWGGTRLIYDHIEYEGGLAPYTNFNLYHGPKIHAHTEDGEPVVLPHANVFAERNGHWKVYMFKD